MRLNLSYQMRNYNHLDNVIKLLNGLKINYNIDCRALSGLAVTFQSMLYQIVDVHISFQWH